ncbi:MAG: branched-chain amino acid ABC transporter permease [Desulfobacterales bacterium]|jgi:branched-chain amino acid transport system permease protein
MKYKPFIIVAVLLFMMALPNLLSPYYRELLIEVLIFGLYCLGFDIIFGFTGLLNFGMSVFFGLGGYLALWSIVYLHCGLSLALALTIMVSAGFCIIYALLISRFRSHYFVAFTIVVSMIFFYFAMAMRPITGADEGLTFDVPDLNLGLFSLDFYKPLHKYYFILAICCIVLFLIWRFLDTPYGRAIVAVRENEDRVRMLGYNPIRIKMVAFTLSGVVASLGGALYVLHLGFDSAHSFFWIWTARAVWWTIIGGVGTLLGAFVGPGVLVFFEDFISSWNADLYLIIMGIIMILVIILAPQGIVGTIKLAFAKREE